MFNPQNQSALIDGVIHLCDPRTGKPWQDATAVASYIEAQTPAEISTPPKVGHLVITSVTLAADKGSIVEEYANNEITVAKGSVLKIQVSVLSDPTDPKSIISALTGKTFRIPAVEQDTQERELFLGTLTDGIINVTVPLDKAGFWEINEGLINSRLPAKEQFNMDTQVFAVVSSA